MSSDLQRLKEWHRAYAYYVAYHSISNRKARENWEKVGEVIRLAESLNADTSGKR